MATFIYVTFCVGFCIAAQGKDRWTFWDVFFSVLSPIWIPLMLGILVFRALGKYNNID